MKKLIFLLLCTLSWPTLAERLFDVEVIVFKRNQNPETVQEKWPDAQPDINLENAVSVFDSTTLQARGLQLLPKSDWQLNDEYNRLLNHAGFKPLVHVAWRQNDGSRGQMPKLRLTAGQNFGDAFYKDGTSKDAPITATDPVTALSVTEPKESGSMYELDGFIRVYVQHYLFIETDLALREPGERKVLEEVHAVETPVVDGQSDTEIEGVTADGQQVADNMEGNTVTAMQKLERTYSVEKYLKSYAFEQKRRMRSGEIHYLDHPLMGLIIQVTRVE
ncbi:peptidoglycan binding protein CsiV [Enterovibrio paralichthyis]|uniref:peptidoglycan binding protein CsiV n=1 Tax=Enterovibrio paralichthyis TaxID=2853805 RepID=UPI001C48DDBA|nr:peptidoglycan binding protein CsiV [Enterovibrio paralichthyis]MBV7297067.1 peptidoglycan binding protein CsiV [Enterovibrio paralichthyis]